VREDPPLVRLTVIALAVGFLGLFIVLPLLNVFAQAFSKGFAAYVSALQDEDTLSAIHLTLLVAFILGRAQRRLRRRRRLAIASSSSAQEYSQSRLIDLPFSVSAGDRRLVFVLLSGCRDWFGAWLRRARYQDHLCAPGIVLATIFVTFRSSCAS